MLFLLYFFNCLILYNRINKIKFESILLKKNYKRLKKISE